MNIIARRELSLVWRKILLKIAFLLSSADRQIAWGVDTPLVWLLFFSVTAS